MKIINAQYVQGYEIQYLDMVIANRVFSQNVVSSIGSGFKSIVGGELRGQTKTLNNCRHAVLNELKEQASALGANAILNVETTQIYVGNIFEIYSQGTAVILKKTN